MYNTIIGIDVSKYDFVVARHGCKDTKTTRVAFKD